MIICILAGGEGTRLWPLSTSDNPKQILSLVGEKTLIQESYTLMSKITKNVFIVSEKSHSDAILKQLKTFDKRKMIVEPSRKGTANCTILAVKHIQKYFKKDISDENILFIHADHIFNNKHAFISCIKNASKERTGNNIVIGGKKPTHPDTKYGYVETKKITSKAYKVLAFHEKPELKIAKFLYKKSNYFWNEGFFICTINSLLFNFKTFNKEIYDRMVKILSLNNVANFYNKLTNESIEKSLMEKSSYILLYPISFNWIDLGTYGSLSNLLKTKYKNVVKGSNIYELENDNCFIYNSTKLNVGVIGLNNIAVVITKNGVLVVNKEKENLVGVISKKINS